MTDSGSPFQLSGVPALSRAAVERAESQRRDTDRLRARWLSARVLDVDVAGRIPVRFDTGGAVARLVFRAAASYGDEPPPGAVFLGRAADVDYWAQFDVEVHGGELVRVPGRFGALVENLVVGDETWVGLREHGDRLDDAGAGLVTTALAMRNWHRRDRYCARCGAPSTRDQFGWVARCTDCGREEYPRTDPAVICLVHDDAGVNGERVLLARGAGWPEEARSVLAGFVEAGESLEACVTREVWEEVGVDVDGVRYLGSQPWPFPRSIMLGFAARANADKPLRLADGEITAARWFTRDEVATALAARRDPTRSRLILPGNSSIARVMLESWVAASG